jgi:hypothetical protein
METTSAKPGQTFVENWIVIHLWRILKYFYFNISYKGKIDSLTPPGFNSTSIQEYIPRFEKNPFKPGIKK